MAARTSPALAAAGLPSQPGHGSAARPWANGPAFPVPGSGTLERAGEDTAPPQRAIINIWKLLAALAIPSYPHCACAIHISLLLLCGGYLLFLLITYCSALKIGRKGKEWPVLSHHGKAKCYILYLLKVKNLSFHKV